MKRLSLNVEALQVESFDTRTVQVERTTAVALRPSYPDPVWTCAYHCTWDGPCA